MLTPQEVERLFATLRQLAAEGCSILYISHKLHEIKALVRPRHHPARRQGGRRLRPQGRDRASSMAELMIGAELRTLVRSARRRGRRAAARRSTASTCRASEPFGIDLEAHHASRSAAGEIFGIAGVAGNGQNELLPALSGERPVARRRRDPHRRQAGRRDSAPAPRRDARPVLRARGAQRPRRRARHVAWSTTPCSAAASARGWSPAGFISGGERASASPTRVVKRLRRPHPRHRRARRAACRAATCRSSSSAARSCRSRACWSSRSRPGASMPARPPRSTRRCSTLAANGAAVLVISQDLDELLSSPTASRSSMRRALRPARHRHGLGRGDRPADGRRCTAWASPSTGREASPMSLRIEPRRERLAGRCSTPRPLLAVALTIADRRSSCSCSWATTRSRRSTSYLRLAAARACYGLVRARREGGAADHDRRRPRHRLPRQCLEHRRRGPVHHGRASPAAAWRSRPGARPAGGSCPR